MGRQIGNDEDSQVMFRKSIYGKSDGGKGSKPRINIYSKQYQDNWEKIFGDKNKKKNEK